MFKTNWIGVVYGLKKPMFLIDEKRGFKSPCITTELSHLSNSYGLPHFVRFIENDGSKEYFDYIKSFKNEEKSGVDVKINNKDYRFFVRRLTTKEVCGLQGIPSWYDWCKSSDNEIYTRLGRGWNVTTIKYIWSYLPKFDRPINVWSLFDGISCSSITLKELGIETNNFISSEILDKAIQKTQFNFPNTIQVGKVEDINVEELIEKYGIPDFICGGSPCQSFSFAGKMQGMTTQEGEEVYTLERYLELKKQGFQFKGVSYLFWEYIRILTDIKKYNPNILFFLENVKMKKKWEACLSRAIGVRGLHFDSSLVSSQKRQRIYWTNIKTKPTSNTQIENIEGFDLPNLEVDINLPEDYGKTIYDVVENGKVEEKYYKKQKAINKYVLPYINIEELFKKFLI